MVSDCEEDLDDFPSENLNSPAESMVEAYRAGSTDQWEAASGITMSLGAHTLSPF